MKRLVFLSDLHLEPQKDSKNYQVFLDLIGEQASNPQTTHLVFMGDIYDMFVGDFSFWKDELKAFWEVLRKAHVKNPNLKIFWIAGNHDFEFFRLAKGEKIELRDPDFELELAGKKLYFAHGDLVNLSDAPYLKWRQTTRSLGFRVFLKLLPNLVAKKIVLPLAQKVSKKSRLRGPRDDAAHMKEIFRNFAQRKWQEGFAGVFLGHNHVPDLFTNGGSFYVNLGSWVEGSEKDSLPFGIWEYEVKKAPEICAANVGGDFMISREAKIHYLILGFQAGVINVGGLMACHRFVSHVTGFASHFGYDAAVGKWDEAIGMLSVPIFFLFGSFLTGWMLDRRTLEGRHPNHLGVYLLMFLIQGFVLWGGVTGYFGTFGADLDLGNVYVLLCLLCLGCGLQNAIVSPKEGLVIRTTHLTGLTTELGVGLARKLGAMRSVKKVHGEGRRNLFRFALIAAFVLGSSVGAFVFLRNGYWGFALSFLTSFYLVLKIFLRGPL